MKKIDLIKDIVVFISVYILPLMVFWKLYLEKKYNRIILFIVSLLYIFLSIFTQNLLPFLLVIICIKYFKTSDKMQIDYYKYNFSLKGFSISSALTYSIFSFFISILVAQLTQLFFVLIDKYPKEQEIVTIMSSLPLMKFIIMMPITMIFAPVVEEFIFRWLLFEKTFSKKIGMVLSVIVSSTIFSTIHFNIRSFAVILWIGIFNCFLIHKKGFWYAVANHSFFNSFSTIVLLLDKIK
ncbi:CPBP family intramembrane glutamic endopeptidase [Clostridium rectalis]|uniref:CPBP family intramembrane glutamic endopeptidase n=1 Tax=Clostridium rectalis TaxID=2040295 RepID=UPI001FAB1AA1|nr:type II CAAX endopeptidase family protein [Clostridium rectalis]